MAVNVQGTKIKRHNSSAATALATASSSGFNFSAAATAIQSTAAGIDFTAKGFTSNMYVSMSGPTSNVAIYRVKSVAATVIGLYDAVSDEDAGAVTWDLTGYAFSDIGGIRGFNGPSGQSAVIDVTTLDATDAKRKMVGLKDEGQISFDMFFPGNNPADATSIQHAAIRADRDSRTVRKFAIEFTDNGATDAKPSALVFDGYTLGYNVAGAVDGAVTGSITIEITSAVQFLPSR